MIEQDKRWTREGHMLKLDDVYAIHVERVVDEHSNAKLSPVQCDAISNYVCRALNHVDLDELTAAWMGRDEELTRPARERPCGHPDCPLLIDGDAAHVDGVCSVPLTPRQHEVMLMLASGATNGEIAAKLDISVKTVDTHRGHVLKRLGLRNNSDVTRYAIRRGYVTP